MNGLKSFKNRLKCTDQDSFADFSLKLFEFQYNNNPVYQEYVDRLGVKGHRIQQPEDIPFLPISAFKHRVVKTFDWNEELIFRSSGTTGMQSSSHYIEDPEFYKDISTSIFKHFYGDPKDYVILGLLPSYKERDNSSLIFMVNNLINLSKSDDSGFYLSNLEELKEKIARLLKSSEKKILLWGVTYALLELAEKYPMNLKDAIIIETGGMKGRGEEVVREQVHDILKRSFKVEHVHSEYGMTELLSQAYAHKDGLYQYPFWMQVLIREINDPFCICEPGQQGVINIIDLANIHSCAFIATEDLGRVHEDGSFEVLGRLDNSDMRGCNLLLY
jgi:phenylacetate-coenzyme A ligase PaaK-like adenylate-forming protein